MHANSVSLSPAMIERVNSVYTALSIHSVPLVSSINQLSGQCARADTVFQKLYFSKS